jgi:hypothetical protein
MLHTIARIVVLCTVFFIPRLTVGQSAGKPVIRLLVQSRNVDAADSTAIVNAVRTGLTADSLLIIADAMEVAGRRNRYSAPPLFVSLTMIAAGSRTTISIFTVESRDGRIVDRTRHVMPRDSAVGKARPLAASVARRIASLPRIQ